MFVCSTFEFSSVADVGCYRQLVVPLTLCCIEVKDDCVLFEGVTSAGIQSVMQQMMQNPQMMSNIMQAPYMQSTFQSLASNPDLINQVSDAASSSCLTVAAFDFVLTFCWDIIL